MRRRLLLLIVAALAAIPVGSAAATAPERAAWWYEPQQLPGTARLPAPPNVPAGGLLVQHLVGVANPSLLDLVPAGTLSGTVAYGAVHATAEPGSHGDLVLRTATGSTALTAHLRACATTAAWNAEDGAGPWFSRPTFDEPCADGEVSTDGTTVTFAIPADLTRDGVLDVAIVPAPEATPFTVAFQPPGDDAVQLHGGTSDADAGYVVGPPPVLPSSAATPLAPLVSPDPAPATPAPPAVPILAQAVPAPARGPLLALVLLAGLATAWVGLTRRRPAEPRSLLARPVD